MSVMTLLPPPGAKDENKAGSQMQYLQAYLKNFIGSARVYWGSPSSFCYQLKDRWKKFNNNTAGG
jgi:hypothetical protein